MTLRQRLKLSMLLVVHGPRAYFERHRFQKKLKARYVFDDERDWPTMIDNNAKVRLAAAPFASPAQIAERARHVRDGSLRSVLLFHDHGRDWPLWESGENYTTAPDDYNLSAELTLRLKHWSDEWIATANTTPQTLDEFTMPATWLAEGEAITRQLAIEVWAFANVYPRFRYFDADQ